MNGCVDPVTDATVNTGGTINIPRAGTSTGLTGETLEEHSKLPTELRPIGQKPTGLV